MKYEASTATEYLSQLPAERKSALQKVRQAIKAALPAGYQELIQYGMITYVVPLKRYPEGYLGKPDTPVPFISLASQKNHMAIYMMCVYGKEEENFRKRYKETGKKLDMGKCCIRFTRLDKLALDIVCEEVRAWPVDRFLKKYEEARSSRSRKSSPPKTNKPESKAALIPSEKKAGGGSRPAGIKKKGPVRKKTPRKRSAGKSKKSGNSRTA
ncbi:MAG: hypothetical protein CMF59_19250 [Leptospiraceae bacterium]|nr:hypothetical protein [Leptospiraceae bacterium]